MRSLRIVLLAVPFLLTVAVVAAPTAAPPALPGSAAVARVDGQAITRAELEGAASGELRKLDIQRHQILERTLDGLVDQRLLELEAARLDLDVEGLLARRSADLAPVTEEEVDAFYEQNQARIRQPKDTVVNEIRGYLEQQRAAGQRQQLLAELRQRHRVETLLPPLRFDLAADDDPPSRGPQGAPVTVTVFSDFQCPFCAKLLPALDQLEEAYGERVRLVFRQFPLRAIHPQAQLAAEASVCAQRQDRFWPLHDALFEGQSDLGRPRIDQLAAAAGLDMESFASCLDGGEARETVAADMAIGHQAGVAGTPTLFVNGRPAQLLRNVPAFDTLSALVEQEL